MATSENNRKRPKYFSGKQLAGPSTTIMRQSMTCLLPQIVTQAQNTQLSLGLMPSNNQRNHRPQSPSRAPALRPDSCGIHHPCHKHIVKHFHMPVNDPKMTYRWFLFQRALTSFFELHVHSKNNGEYAQHLFQSWCAWVCVEWSTLGSTVYQWGTICRCYCC